MSHTIDIGTEDTIFFRSQYGKTSSLSAGWLGSRKFPVFGIFVEGEVAITPLVAYVRTLTLTNTTLSLSGAAYVARNNGSLMEVSRIEKGDVLAGSSGDEKIVAASVKKTEKRALRIVTPEPFLIVGPLLVVFDVELAMPLMQKLPHLSFQRWCELRERQLGKGGDVAGQAEIKSAPVFGQAVEGKAKVTYW